MLGDKSNATASAIDVVSKACIDTGLNLEFILVRSGTATAGTKFSATCDLSEDKRRDCPDL